MGEVEQYLCPFCHTTQRVSAGFWEVIFAQVLTHFSSCAPPSRYPDTAEIMKAAETIANIIAGDAR